MLAIGQAVAVGHVGTAQPPRAAVLADGPLTPAARPGGKEAARAPAAAKAPARPGGKDAARAPAATKAPARPGGTDAARAPAVKKPPARPGGTDAARAPAAAPGTTAPLTDAARRFVRDYYAALDAHDFAAAWRMLSPGVQRAFGGFEPWRRGYSTTTSHAPGGLKVMLAPQGATVGLTLRAGDRGACGEVAERRYAVTWRLARTSQGLRATAASARKISGTEPC